MKKLARLIVFFILYVISVVFITYYALPTIKTQSFQEEESKNIIEILRIAGKAILNRKGATNLRDYILLIFIASSILFVLIQLYVKRIKWRYIVLCPIGLMLLGFMIFELMRNFPGVGTSAETTKTFYYILSISMIISAFISIRYMYHEVFTGKQKQKKIAIPRRHA